MDEVFAKVQMCLTVVDIRISFKINLSIEYMAISSAKEACNTIL